MAEGARSPLRAAEQRAAQLRPAHGHDLRSSTPQPQSHPRGVQVRQQIYRPPQTQQRQQPLDRTLAGRINKHEPALPPRPVYPQGEGASNNIRPGLWRRSSRLHKKYGRYDDQERKDHDREAQQEIQQRRAKLAAHDEMDHAARIMERVRSVSNPRPIRSLADLMPHMQLVAEAYERMKISDRQFRNAGLSQQDLQDFERRHAGLSGNIQEYRDRFEDLWPSGRL